MTTKLNLSLNEASAFIKQARELLPEGCNDVLAYAAAASLTLANMSVSCCEDHKQYQKELSNLKKAEDHLRRGWYHLRHL